ncbi:hypothetical protein [Pseudomonas sp. CHM02]|uniref:hypothetical protein n=1 Tax=Pseudomonas sp. CHM02 TaxID=1463662 RepID=UPI0012DD177B|nr:hypothetical protein [Pseudomonas sp. CHM02]
MQDNISSHGQAVNFSTVPHSGAAALDTCALTLITDSLAGAYKTAYSRCGTEEF